MTGNKSNQIERYELAEILEISVELVGKWINGTRNPTDKHVAKIYQIYTDFKAGKYKRDWKKIVNALVDKGVDLAKELNVDPRTIKRLQSGESKAPLSRAVRKKLMELSC
jgi:transcriptional regulator with XRE-family HTH domain